MVPGTVLGSYEIVSLLGAGGMGEVYRARDTTLGRDVALKLLPAALADDPERVARFQREAQLLASLNHPHIGAIYGLEQSPSAPLSRPRARSKAARWRIASRAVPCRSTKRSRSRVRSRSRSRPRMTKASCIAT